jgi:hypothetical protein
MNRTNKSGCTHVLSKGKQFNTPLVFNTPHYATNPVIHCEWEMDEIVIITYSQFLPY